MRALGAREPGSIPGTPTKYLTECVGHIPGRAANETGFNSRHPDCDHDWQMLKPPMPLGGEAEFLEPIAT